MNCYKCFHDAYCNCIYCKWVLFVMAEYIRKCAQFGNGIVSRILVFLLHHMYCKVPVHVTPLNDTTSTPANALNLF